MPVGKATKEGSGGGIPERLAHQVVGVLRTVVKAGRRAPSGDYRGDEMPVSFARYLAISGFCGPLMIRRGNKGI